MPEKEHDWIPSVIEEGGGGPATVQFKGDPGKAYKEGDVYKGGVIDRIGGRSVTIEPWTPEKGYGEGPPITVRMNQYAGVNQTPRAQMRDAAAETALKKIEKGNTINLDELPWGDTKQLEDFIRPSNPNMGLDIDPPTEEELRDMADEPYPPLSDEEEEEYPEDLRHPAYRDTEPGLDLPQELQELVEDEDEDEDYEDYEQEDTGDVDYIPQEGG